MTQIKATIFNDAEEFLKENLPDFFVDGISAVYPSPTYKFSEDFSRKYYDDEDDESKTVDLAGHVEGLKKLCELIDAQELHVGGVRNARELEDPCNWDVEVVDAYFQILYHGEVIYG